MVEILLACYNGEKYLSQLLDSIYAQDYGDFVITARDDGSNDNTMQILEHYKRKFGKMNIISDGENLGAKGNFARLISNACGDYVMFADHDDKWREDKISTTLGAMQAAECVLDAPILVHTDLYVTDESLNITSLSFTKSQHFNMRKNKLSDFLAQNTVTGCAMMANARLIDLVRNIPSGALMHDWWLALTASAFGKVVYLDEPTIYYRQHANNQVGAVKGGYIADRKATAKDRLLATYKQAKLFLDVFGSRLSEKDRKTVTEYALCGQKGKLSRIITIIKYKTKKQGFVKLLAQLFYC